MRYNSQKIQEWIDSLKIALLENNEDKAYELTQNLPFFIERNDNNQTNTNRQINSNNSNSEKSNRDNQIWTSGNGDIDKELYEYLQIAMELISQSIKLLESKKNETLNQLEKIKKARKFLL
ncbi:hypothetical protein LS73_005090 [Helicobacter muridarum]|uniref:Uncharacterized protein n=1 Tax=Helicobacter muridarum TaxID=216 RepID=A0A4U8TJQ0_9HELI|nr:hypothetical protein LS73_005090 [Helicobacter muridarum]